MKKGEKRKLYNFSLRNNVKYFIDEFNKSQLFNEFIPYVKYYNKKGNYKNLVTFKTPISSVENIIEKLQKNSAITFELLNNQKNIFSNEVYLDMFLDTSYNESEYSEYSEYNYVMNLKTLINDSLVILKPAYLRIFVLDNNKSATDLIIDISTRLVITIIICK